FYTGKPYDAEIGGYVFKYRNYSPETQRWTTADPSGFPDGANNYGYVNAPTIQLDWQGLLQLSTASKQTNDLWRGTPIPGGPLATYEIWSCLTDDGNYAITLLKYISGGFIGANYDSTYNCYGYAFASGQYWIQGDQVENILKGDGYQEVKVDDTDNMINTRVAMSYGDDHSGVPVISDSGVVEQILYKNGGYSGIKGAAPSAVFPNRTPVYYE
ncbi:MAG: hypothetical protein LBD30_03950, partial [Verrucomicrobiales bacterium]|nr:hypothetical protein [Verrucomicrobiales bacterium]